MVMRSCWRIFVEDEAEGCVEGLLWCKDLGNNAYGEFSMAVIQANGMLEDQNQLESGQLSSSSSGPHGTFLGIYDGQGGPEAASASEHREMSNSINVIKRAFLTTVEDFLAMVKKQWLVKPKMASVGSCCLVGVLCDGLLYIANAGDSRVVLGTIEKGKTGVSAIQLSTEHNANLESVRKELKALHPDDPQIVVMKHSIWRVKGIIQVSKSIGDAYLKNAEFNKEPLLPKFRFPEPFEKPILSAEPSMLEHKLQPEDQFLIFASDGLWEHLSNQEAVNIVQRCPHNVNFLIDI